MSERIKFTVYRDTWLRGRSTASSSLLDESGMRCCLGHLARDLGAEDSAIDGACTPRGALGSVNWPPFLLTTPQRASEAIRNSADAFALMGINDDVALSDTEREAQLTSRFAENGVDVEFRDSAEVAP